MPERISGPNMDALLLTQAFARHSALMQQMLDAIKFRQEMGEKTETFVRNGMVKLRENVRVFDELTTMFIEHLEKKL